MALKSFLCSALPSEKTTSSKTKNTLTYYSNFVQCGLQDTIVTYIARAFLFVSKRHFVHLPVCQEISLQLHPAMSVPLHPPSLFIGIKSEAAQQLREQNLDLLQFQIMQIYNPCIFHSVPFLQKQYISQSIRLVLPTMKKSYFHV